MSLEKLNEALTSWIESDYHGWVISTARSAGAIPGASVAAAARAA